MKNKYLKISLILISLVVALIGIFMFRSPSVHALSNTDLNSVKAITTPTPVTTMDRVQIHEHRGYSIYANWGSKAETKTYENAAGNTGIPQNKIQSYIDSKLSPFIKIDTYAGWLHTLLLNTSVFCRESGTPFPSLQSRVFNGFHVSEDTNTYTKKGDEKVRDYIEWCPDLVCAKKLNIYKEDYDKHGVELVHSTMSEADVWWGTDFKYVMKDFYIFTTVRVRYWYEELTFDTTESYIFTYSLRNYYTYNPTQLAVWKYKNDVWDTTRTYCDAETVQAAKDLYASAKAVNELKDPVKPQISKTTASVDVSGTSNKVTYSTGTVISGDNYKIGPFKMNGYDLGWTASAKNFSGQSSVENPANKELLENKSETQIEFFKGIIAGIVEARVKLDNIPDEFILTGDNIIVEGGSTASGSEYYSVPTKADGYEYPTPDSTFYILLPIKDCKTATKVEKISFKYKWHTADGNGGNLDGYYDELWWEPYGTVDGNTETTYHCDNSYGGDACIHDALPWNGVKGNYTSGDKHNVSSCWYGYGWGNYDVNAYSHDFWCGGKGWCQYGSSADSTTSWDVSTGSTRYTDKITLSCSSHWKCGTPYHMHGNTWSNGSSNQDYVNDSETVYYYCKCDHDHVKNCFTLGCGKTPSTLICTKSEHTHVNGCYHWHDGDCKRLADGSMSCDMTSGEKTCGETAHTHTTANGCYHKHTGDSSDGSGCYSTQVCPHYPGTSTCANLNGCCDYTQHTHSISSCGKTHDCGKTYCIHGFDGGKHTCRKETGYTATGHKGTSCDGPDWGDTHIGACYGPKGEGTRCNMHQGSADGGGHRNCATFQWHIKQETVKDCQMLMYVSDAQVYEHNVECYIGEIPLITKLEIDKFVYEVTHATTNTGGVDTTFSKGENRKLLEETDKFNNPVYVETDDMVTYKIIVENFSKFGVKVIVDDILPEGEDVYKFISAYIGNQKINTIEDLRKKTIEINAESTSELTITIQIKANNELGENDVYENKARIITRNDTPKNSDDDIDYIRTIDDDGPIVNHIDPKCQGTKETPDWESSDWVKLNNYNVNVDKYIYKYNETVLETNNTNRFTKETRASNKSSHILTDYEKRVNSAAGEKKVSDGNVEDTVKIYNQELEEYKKNHPVNVEQNEKVTYAIKVINNATTVTKTEATGNKPATQVKPTLILDKLHRGLKYTGKNATVYKADNTVKQNVIESGISVTLVESGEYNVYEIRLDDSVILNPGEYVLVFLETQVVQSNMYLHLMGNSAEVKEIANVNGIDVTHRNISEQQITSDYVRMKDLVISGKVWVDFNRNGKMDESPSAEQINHYDVDDAGMKGGILVKLYRLDDEASEAAKVVRTTKTNDLGEYTFARGENLSYYQTFNHTKDYQDILYQRVDKADKKDASGNYSADSKYYRYYIEYVYDGVVYKSTEFYAGMKNLTKNDGSVTADYIIDSNAAELTSDREAFNKRFEYISYDVAYDMGLAKDPLGGGDLDFDKDGHISTLIEDDRRDMTAKSFIVDHNKTDVLNACKTAMNSCGSAKWKQCSNHWDDWQVAISMGIIDESLYPNTADGRKAAQAYLKSIYDSLSNQTGNNTEMIKYLWLYSYNDTVDNSIPKTDYLKYINLGLELREDVDIALTKDVYSVKTTIDGEEVEYSLNQLDILNGEGSNRDYIIDKPYGLELYESDYKKRTDQYASQAVRDYKGTESELNVEVTYRMTVNNIPVRDEYTMDSSTDTNLFVKIHEILDLYDQNFMTYSNDNTVTVKTKNANGFLEDKTVKVSEAWYFKEGGSGTKYSISNADEVAKGAKPFYIEDPNGTYTKVALVVSNESSRGNGVFSNKANDFTNDGYKTMYIRGMDGFVLDEGEEFDIYVKYTLDKDTADVKVSSSYSETKSERSSSSINIDGDTLEFAVQGESSTSTNVQLHRALRIAEDDKDKKNGRGIENIAQINAYSVWYNKAATKPASIVDVDSNAGNIGVTNGRGSKNVGTADEVSLYEDTAYKTGVEIAAENTENDPDDVNTRYGIRIITKLTDLTRKITGRVWDDSRTETLDTGSGNLYHGDGINESSKETGKKTKNGKAQSNILIDEGRYMKDKDDNAYTENVDIPVRNAKAEFVEIVQISADKYYEQVLTDVTWEQKQHDRTDKTGTYLLDGLTPGTYIVRFTYGDTVDEKEDGVEDVALANRDMQIFNGQDYKSTKYTMALENGQLSVDEVIRRFNQENTSDARDDEMRRLTVNKYSEVMTNEKAEILKGLVNNEIEGLGTRYGEDPGVKNTPDDLQTLTDNTYMEAETVEFTIKPEKLLAEAAYYREATPEERAKSGSKVTRVTYNDTNGIQVQKYTTKKNDIYYNALEIIKNSDIYDRAFAIYNLDFGIEYRPESQISLTKEINQMKLTAEDGTVLVDLFFDTSKTTEGKTVHTINKEKSKGLEVVQFITNDYTNFAQALIKDIQNEEHTQGFVYIQVDDEILQGATVEITYKFYAQNNSEIDLIRDTLDVIRFKENKQTNELVKSKGPDILDTTYTASGTAENILFAEMYKEDGHGDLYRTKQKLLINTGTDEGYFGRFVGYSYYTGEKFARDVVACLKFDKILDYIDTNLEFKQETNNDLLENRFWTITNPTELKPYVYALRKGGVDLTPVGTLTNVEGQEYKALVVSVDDGLYDNMPDRIPDNAATLGNGIVNNKELSRFLLPEKADNTPDKTDSTGYIYLPTSKVIAAETDTDNLQYENIAEIVQFTTLTGRRTNFETTIGNANIHKAKRSEPSKGSPEFDTAALEPDTAATETITLTPPTGLMLSRRKIVNVVDVASKGVGITVIVAAVVAIVFGITTVTSLIIKKRRIK